MKIMIKFFDLKLYIEDPQWYCCILDGAVENLTLQRLWFYWAEAYVSYRRHRLNQATKPILTLYLMSDIR